MAAPAARASAAAAAHRIDMPTGTNGIVTRQIRAPSSATGRPMRGPQMRGDHGHEAGRQRGVEPPAFGVDRLAEQRPAERAQVPAHEDRHPVTQNAAACASGRPGRSPSPSSRRSRGGRRRDGARADRRDRAPSSARRRRCGRRAAASCRGPPPWCRRGDDADGAELRCAREHEQRHHARLQHRAAGRHGRDTEHGAEHADRDADRRLAVATGRSSGSSRPSTERRRDLWAGSHQRVSWRRNRRQVGGRRGI